MAWVALKMLTGDRAKFVGIVMGLTFAALLITQQGSIFCGLMLRTAAQITDISGADLWVMDVNVRYIDDVKPMIADNLYRVRGVNGVLWAVPLYKGMGQAKVSFNDRASGGRVDVIESVIKRMLIDYNNVSIENYMLMSTCLSELLDVLPSTGDRVGGEPGVDAADRRAVPEDAVLRQSADDGVLGAARGGGQLQAGPAADGLAGNKTKDETVLVMRFRRRRQDRRQFGWLPPDDRRWLCIRLFRTFDGDVALPGRNNRESRQNGDFCASWRLCFIESEGEP